MRARATSESPARTASFVRLSVRAVKRHSFVGRRRKTQHPAGGGDGGGAISGDGDGPKRLPLVQHPRREIVSNVQKSVGGGGRWRCQNGLRPQTSKVDAPMRR